MNVLERYKKLEEYSNNSVEYDSLNVWQLREEQVKLANLLGPGNYDGGHISVGLKDEKAVITSNHGIYETVVALGNSVNDVKDRLLDSRISIRDMLEAQNA